MTDFFWQDISEALVIAISTFLGFTAITMPLCGEHPAIGFFGGVALSCVLAYNSFRLRRKQVDRRISDHVEYLKHQLAEYEGRNERTGNEG